MLPMKPPSLNPFRMRAIFQLLVLLSFSSSTYGQTVEARQDFGNLIEIVEQFLSTQTAGLPGEVSIAVGRVDSRTSLHACASVEPFLPAGSRPWGKTTVGVRCTSPAPWIIYVQANVRVLGEYVVTRVPLSQGQTIGANDLAIVRGDLASLPSGIIMHTSQAVGRAAALSIPSGAPLRNESLKTYPVVQQGQSIRLVSSGPGFQVSTEGRALTNGTDGQIVQARTASGQLVSGVAKVGGVIEVTY
jgi:flagella basal body P-ring formation protein FlgA